MLSLPPPACRRSISRKKNGGKKIKSGSKTDLETGKTTTPLSFFILIFLPLSPWRALIYDRVINLIYERSCKQQPFPLFFSSGQFMRRAIFHDNINRRRGGVRSVRIRKFGDARFQGPFLIRTVVSFVHISQKPSCQN